MGWIKVSTIIGFVFTAILALFFCYSVISGLSSGFSTAIPGIDSGSPILSTIFGIIGLAVFFFFMFGFVQTGKNTENRMLRISSWIVFFSSAVLVLFTLILVYITKNPSGSLITDILGFLGSTIKVWFILFGLLILALVVGFNLFYVAIAEHRGKVGFSRLSAVFGILAICFGPLSLLVGFYLIVISIFSGPPSFLTILILNIPYLLETLAMFFASMFLREAAIQFDGGSSGGQMPISSAIASSYSF